MPVGIVHNPGLSLTIHNLNLSAMDVRHMQAFRAVIEQRSMTAAARQLGISQPAISGLIQRFEQDIGFPLFDRARTRVEPTPEAVLLYDEVRRSIAGFDRVAQVADDLRRARTGPLIVASHPSVAISVLPAVAARFAASHPGARVRFMTRSSQLVKELIPLRAFDVGIAELPVDSTAVDAEVFDIECVCVLARRDPLARHAALSPRLLSGVPFIAMFPEHMLYRAVAGAFEEAGAAWNVIAEAEFTASACAMAATGAGVAVVDLLTARTFAPIGLVRRPFRPPLRYTFAVFRPPVRPPSQRVHDFLALLRDHIASFAAKGKA